MIYVVCWLFIRDALIEALPCTPSTESSPKPSDNVGKEVDTEEMPEDATEEVLEVYNDVQTKNPKYFNHFSFVSCQSLRQQKAEKSC